MLVKNYNKSFICILVVFGLLFSCSKKAGKAETVPFGSRDAKITVPQIGGD